MRIDEINKKVKDKYIVLLPKADYDIRESVEYSFNNVIYLDFVPTEEDTQTIIDYINNKGEQLILFDYDDSYRLILPHIRKQKKVKWVLKDSIAGLTDGGTRATFTNLMEFCDRNIVKEIGCLDYSTYLVLKNSGYKVSYLSLDIKRKNSIIKNSNSIGIIGNDYNPNHNIYNQLSSLKLVDYSEIKMLRTMPATEHFISFFGIKEKKCETQEEVISNNFVNLYCNFTFTNKELILKSMDSGVPCLLGNTDFFDNYPKLKKYLVLESDDDINEISQKITLVKHNIKIIMNDYELFREKYTESSEKSVLNFLRK